ncbi:MAG: hypothetical protein QT10_C0008G0044 [archaeon GW2011_AR19]|nr:MAG: hypothetical protein QT10_C0008G0044 [archaeon GW2011_AR19]
MLNAKSTIIKGAISLLIGIGGLCYIKSFSNKNIEYNPLIIKKNDIEVWDINRDGVADVVQSFSGFSQKYGIKNKLFVNPDIKKQIIKYNHFFDMYGYSKPLSPELQSVAACALKTNDFNELEKNLIEFK